MPRFALFLALFVTACNSGSGSSGPQSALPQEYGPIEPCVMDGMQVLSDIIRRNAEVLTRLRDPASSGIATPTADPTVWSIDAGGLTGSATFSSDPAGGMQLGDSVEVTWTYTDATRTGAGTFTVLLLSDTEATLHGSGEIDAGDGCTLDIDIAATDALVVDLASFSALAGATAATPLAGTIVVNLVSGANTFSVTVQMGAGGISLTNASLNGTFLPGVTLPWPLFPAPPPLPPAPSGAVTANWDGTWHMFYRCVLFGNPLFDGRTTIEIEHTAGATSFTGTEAEGNVVYVLGDGDLDAGGSDNIVANLGQATAIVKVEYEYTPASGPSFDVIEEATWTWYAAGDPINTGAPERICKLGRVVRKDTGEVLYVCFGTALRDPNPAEDPLLFVCGSWTR